LPEIPPADSPAPRLRIGDHLVSSSIYLGNGQVIHYAGLASGLQAGPFNGIENSCSGSNS
jgi:hypothetical protein